jgi:hypothetical protein
MVILIAHYIRMYITRRSSVCDCHEFTTRYIVCTSIEHTRTHMLSAAAVIYYYYVRRRRRRIYETNSLIGLKRRLRVEENTHAR